MDFYAERVEGKPLLSRGLIPGLEVRNEGRKGDTS